MKQHLSEQPAPM